MVVVEGHIFAGVWLVDGAFADILVDDPSQLEKRYGKRHSGAYGRGMYGDVFRAECKF